MAGFGTFSGGGLGFGVTFTLEDGFSAVAGQIQSKMAELDTGVQRLSDKINTALGRVQSGIALIATGVALAAPLAYGVQIAGEFEQAKIGLETFVGSAKEAQKVFDNIKNDAAATPFGIQPLLAVNKALISTGLNADIARKDTMALANAIAATGGGNEELQRMAINMQQIRNVGAASAVDIKQFAYAGINVFQLLQDSTGLTREEVQKLNITYELLADSLQKASEKGGIYADALGRQAASINGKLEAISDKVKFLAAGLGNAVIDFVHPLFDALIVGLNTFTEFIDTDLGRLITQFVAFGIALVSLTVIGAGLVTVFSAISSFVIPLLASLSVYLWPIAVLGAYFIIARNAISMFNDVVSETSVPLNGLGGIMQRLGGILSVTKELWDNVDFSNSETKLRKPVADAMDKLGMSDFVSDMATWVIRLKTLWENFYQSFSNAWSKGSEILWQFYQPVNYLIEGFDSLAVRFGIGESKMEGWAAAGKLLGYGLAAAFSPLILIGFTVVAVFELVLAIFNVVSSVVNKLLGSIGGLGGALELLISPLTMFFDKEEPTVKKVGKTKEPTITNKENNGQVRAGIGGSYVSPKVEASLQNNEANAVTTRALVDKSKQLEKSDQPIVVHTNLMIDKEILGKATTKYMSKDRARKEEH